MMKRSLLLLLGVIVFAGWVGTLISRDPGYVLISYDGYSLQTSLWVAIVLILAIVLVVYYGLKFFRIFANSGGYVRGWQQDRKKNRAHDLTSKGIKHFLEGEFDRAEKFLVSGANNNESGAINLILAAQAADRQGNYGSREKYLQESRLQDSGIEQAAAVAAAQMSAAEGDWEKSLAAVDGVKVNATILALRKDAMFHLADWEGLLEMLPALKKSMGKIEFVAFQKQIVLARMGESGLTEDGLKIIYKNLPKEVRFDSDLVTAYCSVMPDENEKESVLRSAINDNWTPELLQVYGSLGNKTLSKRLKQVEIWHKKHVDDAALQLCLGRLYEESGEREKAREAFEKSVELMPSSEANIHLAGLLSFDGDYVTSNQEQKSAVNNKS